jgi:hypothetical protein
MKRIEWMRGAVFALCTTCQLMAMNGIAVHTAWWWPFADEYTWTGDKYPRGKLVVARIVNNQVTSRDTIFKGSQGTAQYPALNYNGSRVAFFRWGIQAAEDTSRRYHIVSGTASAKNYISVINIDGTGLQNLVEVATPCNTSPEAGEGNCVLDWTCGQWIYYEKPTKTGQIWRINVVNPSLNQQVANYGNANLRRWELNWGATCCAWQTRTPGVFNGGAKFPSLQSQVGLVACNASISCSGTFLGHYYGGNHTLMCATKVSPSTMAKTGNNSPLGAYNEHTVEQIEGWIKDTLMLSCGGCDLIRWAVNSDKWALRMIGWTGQADKICNGSNQVAVNWKESQAVNISHIPPPLASDKPCDGWAYSWTTNHHSTCADAGDLWVDFGPNNLYKWEDENGTLNSISSIDPTNIKMPLPGQMSDIAKYGIMLATTTSGMRAIFPDSRCYTIQISDLFGRRIAVANGVGCVDVGFSRVSGGLYLARISAEGRSFVVRVPTRT